MKAKPIQKSAPDSQNLTEYIDEILDTEQYKVTQGLLSEVDKIHTFLNSAEIPWKLDPMNDANKERERNKEVLSKIEKASNQFWSAISSLVLKDEKREYENSIIGAISFLSQQVEPPIGPPFQYQCRDLRYYPLFVALYLISITGVAKRRDALLKNIFKIDFIGRPAYDPPTAITDVLFLIRTASDFFQPLYPEYPKRKWIDPVPSYTKSLVKRIINPNDFWLDKDKAFYIGEFVLSLSPLDALVGQLNGTPAPAFYIYFDESIPFITRYIKKEQEFLRRVFNRPLNDILSDFDSAMNNNIYRRNVFQGHSLSELIKK